MSGTWIDISTVDGEPYSAYLSLPRQGTGPGLVMLPEVFGVNAAMRAAADLFAEEGYVVLVPDLFWRAAQRIELGDDLEGLRQAIDLRGKFDVDRGVQDIGAALSALRARPEHAGKVAALGYGLGGLLAYLAAARLPVDAVVCFYGGEIDQYLAEVANIRCPMVLHFGGRDPHIPPRAVQEVRAALAASPEVLVYVYPDAEHGFSLPGRSTYDRGSAEIAHSRSVALLRGVLGPRYDLGALWDRHSELEFSTRDADATMTTMVAEPYVNHVPTMTGGVGYEALHRFYENHFIPKLPKDTRLVPISRTIGADRVVDEILFCFTHDTEIDFLLPGIPPTGRYIEVPTVAVVCFRGDRLYHEHIYWDQASVLVQIGLLDPHGLPVAGIETARKVVDDRLPSNTLMARWSQSEPKPNADPHRRSQDDTRADGASSS